MSGALSNPPQEGPGADQTAAATVPNRPNLPGRIFQNAVVNIVGRGLALVFSAGATAVLARYLGSEKLGQYGAIYAYLSLFAWMATFGFEPVLVREISRERGNASHLVRTAMILSLLLSTGTVAVAVALSPIADYRGHLRALLILAGLEYVLIPLRLPGVIFQVEMRQWYGAAINVFRQGIWFAMIIALWVLGAPLSYVIAARVLAALVESLLIWGYSRQFIEESGRFLRERAATLFSQSFPIAFTSLLAMIYLRIDQVMLHKMVSDSVLGQYVAAVKVSELIESLPTALMFTLTPILSVSVIEPERFRNQVDRAFRYFMLLSCALCVFMTVGGGLVIHVLYGNEFSSAVPLLAVLIWSEIAVFFASVVVNVLIARNEQRLLPIPTLVGAAINVALNLVFIPRYAAVGAAWATLISYTAAWMVALLFFKRTRSLTMQGLRYALPIGAMALLAVACSKIVPFSGVRPLAACVFFLAVAWLTRFVRASDLEYVSAAGKQSFRTVSNRMAGQ